MNIIKVNNDSQIAPGYWALSDCEPHAITGLVKAETIAKWKGRNEFLLRPGEYTITDGIVGGTDVNSIDNLILSQIVQNVKWLIKQGHIVAVDDYSVEEKLREYIHLQCAGNDIRPTEEEISAAIAEGEAN